MPFLQAILVLACLLHGAARPAHATDLQACPDSDFDCFERNQVAACHERLDSTIETCLAWIGMLERQAAKGSNNAELHLAHANVALAANLVTDPAAQSEYEARARSIYQERIRRDSNDAEAMIALATLVDEENEKIDLLKRGVALKPERVHAALWLASLLQERDGPGDALTAANYMEQAYDAMKPERWAHHASDTYWYFQQAGADDQAARFRARVIDDWGAHELANVTADTTPEEVKQTLDVVCDGYATGVLGTQMCWRSIAIVVRNLSAAGVTTRTQALADAAARAMEDVGRGDLTLECEPSESHATFRSQLDALLELGFESAPMHSAYARVAPCDEQITITEERIAVQIRKIDDRTTEVSGIFRASPEYLFTVLTQPEQQKQWMSGDGFALDSAEVDGRAGGGFRYVYARPSGKLIEVRGAYSAFDPPRGFAYVESYDFSPLKIYVEVTLQDMGGETRYQQTLQYPTAQERDDDFDGVARSTQEALAKLARYLSSPPPGD